MKSSKGTVQLVATNNIFYEDINSHERRITWRCSKFYTKTPDRDRCQVSICLRSGLIAYVKGRHNHPDTFIESKHSSRRCEVDMSGKYKITGQWMPEKKPYTMDRRYPEIRMKMKEQVNKFKTQRHRGLQNLTHLNLQLSSLMAAAQMARPSLSLISEPAVVNNNSNNVNQGSQVSQAGQMSQGVHRSQASQVNQPSQMSQVIQIGQVRAVSQGSLVNQVSQPVQVSQAPAVVPPASVSPVSVSVASNAKPRPSDVEEKDVSWHIPTFEGFF